MTVTGMTKGMQTLTYFALLKQFFLKCLPYNIEAYHTYIDFVFSSISSIYML